MRKYIYGYVRVSTELQSEGGISLQAQRERIAERAKIVAKRHKLTIGKIYSDAAVSATRTTFRHRSAGGKLFRDATAGDHIIIAKLDRGFRSTRDCLATLEAFRDRGVVIHLLDLDVDTSTPMGQLMITIMAAMAQWEAARIGERIRDANREMRQQKRSTNGKRVIGYKIVRGKLLADHDERKIGRQILHWRADGLTYREIAERLNKKKVRRRKSANTNQQITRWNAQAVGRLWEAARNHFPLYKG